MQAILDKPDKPFVMDFAAPRDSGKSYMLVKVIKPILSRYEDVHVMCQSLDSNSDYASFMVDPDIPEYLLTKKQKMLRKKFTFNKHPSSSSIQAIMDEMEEEKCTQVVAERFNTRKKRKIKKCKQVLIILDDCLDTGLLNRQGILDTLAERGRHMNISVIITTQVLRKLSLNVRTNSEYMFFFSPFSYSEMEKYLEEFVPRELVKYSRKKFIDIFKTDYQFILVRNDGVTNPLEKLMYGDVNNFLNNTLKFVLPQDGSYE